MPNIILLDFSHQLHNYLLSSIEKKTFAHFCDAFDCACCENQFYEFILLVKRMNLQFHDYAPINFIDKDKPIQPYLSPSVRD